LHISSIENKRILDAGCGPAGINIVLENNMVDAFDPLIEQYKDLPHFNPKLYPYVQFQQSTLEDFSAKVQYDLIFCLNAINHVSDIQKSYTVLSQSIKVGGTMVISIDAHNHPFFKQLFRLIPGDALHPHQFDLEEYKQFVENEGLEIIANYNIEKGFFFDYWAMVVRKK
jgi:2-polyprenyl-6-hydroxyphenyl methylase/3-demethylubiquinone-9 3-methyltransferase